MLPSNLSSRKPWDSSQFHALKLLLYVAGQHLPVWAKCCIRKQTEPGALFVAKVVHYKLKYFCYFVWECQFFGILASVSINGYRFPVSIFVLSRVQEPDLVRLMSEEEGSSRLNETPDLLILSNDIPTSPTEELVIAGEEEDDPGQYYNCRHTMHS